MPSETRSSGLRARARHTHDGMRVADIDASQTLTTRVAAPALRPARHEIGCVFGVCVFTCVCMLCMCVCVCVLVCVHVACACVWVCACVCLRSSSAHTFAAPSRRPVISVILGLRDPPRFSLTASSVLCTLGDPKLGDPSFVDGRAKGSLSFCSSRDSVGGCS